MWEHHTLLLWLLGVHEPKLINWAQLTPRGPGACTEGLPSRGHHHKALPPSISQALEKAALGFITVDQGSFLSYVQAKRALAWGLGLSLPGQHLSPVPPRPPCVAGMYAGLPCMPVRAGASQTLPVGLL